MTKSRSGRGKKKLSVDSAQSKTIALIGEGQLLAGRYRVIEKIGTGGMGIVYKAKDEKLDDRLIALKALPPDMSTSKAAIKRLKKEALAAIDMHHPNIMALHSFDNDGPHHFLVMEFLDGPDLEDALVDEDKFSVDAVIEVAQQVCPALDYAHKRGIVHRDIKPSNLIYKTEGDERVIKIADFGIAYQVRNSIARLTGQDTTSGTMHYMPPEQLAGKDVDGRADQYALAVTLYELLRGRPPFEGAGMMLMRQIDEAVPDEIDGVPAHVNAALVRALAKKADDRFESCKQLLEALEGEAEVAADEAAAAPSTTEEVEEVVTPIAEEAEVPLEKKEDSSKQQTTEEQQELAKNLSDLMKNIGMTAPAGSEHSHASSKAKDKPPVRPVPAEEQGGFLKPMGLLFTFLVAAVVWSQWQPVTAKTPKSQQNPTPRTVKRKTLVEVTFKSIPPGAKVYSIGSGFSIVGDTSEPFSKAFKPGKHRFKFANVYGHRDKEVSFEVKTDGPQLLEVQLEKEEGHLRISIIPPDATVTVDNKPYLGGAMSLWPGKHEVAVSKSGYQPKSERVTIVDGETKTLNLTLVALPQHKIGETKTVAGMKFCWCPPGEFMMGSPKGGNADERPQHKVKLTKGFWLGKHEVTQSQWQSVMGSNPSKFKGKSDRPVDRVSWNDCQKFIQKLNKRHYKKAKFRLPTEAQWEYACRAGTTGSRYGALNSIAWHGNNSGFMTRNVGQKKANAWGLHDMHGNVCEWCNDWYSKRFYRSSPGIDPVGPSRGSARVYRGSAWRDLESCCRAAKRSYISPGSRGSALGFRLLMED